VTDDEALVGGEPRLVGTAETVPPPPVTPDAGERPIAEAPMSPAGPLAPTSPAGPPAPPRALEIVSRGIDLNVLLSGQVRQMSIRTGLLFLFAVGPIALLAIARTIRTGGLAWLADLIQDHVTTNISLLAGLAVVIGVFCAGAISIDTQNAATTVVGGRAAGHRIGVATAFEFARSRFWAAVFAATVVRLILAIPQQVISTQLRGVPPDTLLPISTTIEIVLAMPFAYLGAAVVLGRSGPIAAVGASIRMAARRWRLAFMIGVVNTAVSYIALFAVGSGLGLLARLADALGIDRGIGVVQGVELAAIVALAILAVGSLVMTISALTVAPQVVAWLGLGGSTEGVMEAVRTQEAGQARRSRVVSRPMQAALAVELIAAVAALLTGV